MSLQGDFPKGCRVRCLGAYDGDYMQGRRGTVVGYGKTADCLRVKRDGRKDPVTSHRKFWVREEAQ